MMESSKLKIEKKNKLYFNKFEYKAVCKIQGAVYTYYSSDFESFVSRMDKFTSGKKLQGLQYGVRILDKEWKEYWDEVNIEQISKFITWRNQVSKQKCLIRIQSDNVSFFSNDIGLLRTLSNIDTNVKFFQVEILESDKLYFKKEPKYRYRTYFRSKRMPKDFSDNIHTLQGMYSSLNFSKAIFNLLFHNNWNPYRYMHGSYFVEYNDEQMITILSMWFPDMLAKTYVLAKEP